MLYKRDRNSQLGDAEYRQTSSSVLSRVWVPDLEGAAEQVFSKGIDRVLRLSHTNVLEALGQEGDQVVLQIHADVLGLCIQHILLLLTEHLDVLFRLRLLLLLDYLL